MGVTGRLSGSDVVGRRATTINGLQRAPQRYYQRPERPHVWSRSDAHVASGLHRPVMLNRNTGIWRVNASLWGVSPGFESNDLGFLSTADRGGMHAVWTLRDNTPGRLLRSRFFWFGKWYTWNFNRDLQSDGAQGSYQMQFLNYWNLNVNSGWNRTTQNDRLTRGGRQRRKPGGTVLERERRHRWTEAAFDERLLQQELVRLRRGQLWHRHDRELQTFQPPDDLHRPNWNRQPVKPPSTSRPCPTRRPPRPMADAMSSANSISRQLTLQTRVTALVSSKMSITLFMQPLIAVGDYTEFKELQAPRTLRLHALHRQRHAPDRL